jgi:hypothetical protein
MIQGLAPDSRRLPLRQPKATSVLCPVCFLGFHCFLSFFFFFAVLGLEPRAYTLSHSTALCCDGFFDIGSQELFAQAASNLNPDLCLLSS